MDNLFAEPPPPWPEQILVEPSRMEMGIWGNPEGDIEAAYCGDTFPEVKTFCHQGHSFTHLGGTACSADCYPLLPMTEGICPEPIPYSREGSEVVCRGKKYRLGRKVKFTSRACTLPEGIDFLQRRYAYGGSFAYGKTYREMLLDFREHSELPEWERPAIDAELARRELPQTQAEMLEQIRKRGDGSAPKEEQQTPSQLTLGGF